MGRRYGALPHVNVAAALWVHSRTVEGVNIIERAFQLATESGSMDEVRRKLAREGYFHVERHLSGRQIRADLTQRLDPTLVAGHRLFHG